MCSHFVSGAPWRTTAEANQPSWQRGLGFPESATTYQSPQPSAQPSTNNFLGLPFMTTPQAVANTLGGSATNLTTHAPSGVMGTGIPYPTQMHAPSGVMGTGIPYHARLLPPDLQAFVNQMPPSRAAAAARYNR